MRTRPPFAPLFALLLAALPLLGCGPSRPPAPPEPPEVAECRREARASDEYRDFFRSAAPGQEWRQAFDARVLEDRLTRACLERKGLLRPGVEPVRPLRP